jgi:HEAT repeat protein
VGDGLEIVQQIRDDAKLQVVIEAGAGVSEEDVQRIKQLVEVARQQRDPRNRELWEQIAQRQDATLRKEALEKLQAMLGSEQNPDREQAMRTLQKVKDVPFDRAPLLPRVRQLIADRRQTAYTRAIAAVQLANLGGGKEDTPLIAALADDPEAFVRKGVAAALYGLDPQGQHPLIAPAIEKLLSDESADVEGVVHHTIKALWGMPVSPAAEVRLVELSKLPGPSSGIGYDAVYYALSTRPVISKPVAERLAELALGPDTQGHVGRAVWGLSHHPASEDARELVVGTLIRILDDTLDSSLRQDCVFGLGLQGGPTAVKKLEEISAQEENAALREQAKSALGRAQAKAPSS